ncbi:MAG: aminoglycoside 6'-N-acetyltransferase I [Planctomycetota bacterium]|jgi:aminoglycoside 6'-N-acetyltransferase I
MITVRLASQQDTPSWIPLRLQLWPEDTKENHAEEVQDFLAGGSPFDEWAVLLAENEEGRVQGFVEISIRPYAEGCHSKRVGYVEGWYVSPHARGEGVGRILIEAAEEWGRSLGCTELASDAELENSLSRSAHGALGFQEVSRVRCFRKDLQ